MTRFAKIQFKHTGFTLLEVLFIVAIIAILAALVIPRLMMPREQVLAEEAQEFLETIRLSQINVRDRGSAPGWTLAKSYRQGEAPDPGWNILAVKPLTEEAPFAYVCHPDRGACTAKRVGSAGEPKTGGIIAIDLETGNFYCEAPYAVIGSRNGLAVCG